MAKLHSIGLLVAVTALMGCLQIGYVSSQKQPTLEILPTQSVQRKPVGKSLMLTCRPDVPDANLVTDLQWRDNQNMTVKPKPAGQSAPPMYTEVLPGDQSLALLISALTDGMAGMYYCTASYANTEPMAIGVKIETYVAITWQDAPENQYPIAGETYMVKCAVTANPAPSVDWLRNGDPIKSGGRYVVETRGLLIRDVDETDDGIYTCRAAVIQTGELVERNIRVEVQIKPRIGNLPERLEAVEEQQFSVMCNATGKPVPEFTWIKDSTQQNMATADRFLVNPQTGQLSITRVTQEDYGTYTCVARNSAGHDEVKTLLDVLVRPRIYEFLNVTVTEDKEGEIVCKATGRPAPAITFRRFGSTEEYTTGEQANDDRVTLITTANEERGESTGTLRISKLIRPDDGLYECVARNRGEQAFKVGHITVEYKPSFEHMLGQPPVYTWEERRANLSCLAQGFPNATIEWRWNDRLIKDLVDPNLQIEGNGPRSDLLITPRDRRYYTAYKCIATNKLGRVEHMMELREARIPDAIVEATPRIVTATTVTFNIIGPATEIGLPITAISVQYKEQTQIDWLYAFNRTWSPESTYIVEGLRPQTAYNFRFAARNRVGLGQWGAYKLQSTPRRSAPESPRILHNTVQNEDNSDSEEDEPIVVSPYSDHFELGWSVPADNGEPINSYQVRYCPGHKKNGDWHEIENTCVTRDVPPSETSGFKMTGLQGDTYYRIELRAHNAIGHSEPTSLTMRTARGSDLVIRVDSPVLSSATIVGIAIAVVFVLLLLIDFLCCMLINAGIMAALCRRTKRSPSELDDEAKIGREEREPLSTNGGPVLKNSSVEFDGRVVHSRSGEIIGKNSSV